MNILITAATETELAPLSQCINSVNNKTTINCKFIQLAVTGIGITLTTYQLTKLLQANKYDLVVNIGIAGSFSNNIAIGDTVLVQREYFADWGVYSPNGFATVFDEKIMAHNTPPFNNGALYCPYTSQFNVLNSLPQVTGVTVNATSGNDEQIKSVYNKFTPDVESMEGAAFFYVCLMENIPFIEIRSISNRVEKRDKSKWNIPLAINNLSKIIANVINHISY